MLIKKERYVLKGITIPKLARRVEFTITVGGGVEYNAPTAYYDGKKLIRDWGTYDFDISKHQGESGKEFIVKFDKELTSKITVEFWMN